MISTYFHLKKGALFFLVAILLPIRLAAAPADKPGIWGKITGFFSSVKSTFFGGVNSIYGAVSSTFSYEKQPVVAGRNNSHDALQSQSPTLFMRLWNRFFVKTEDNSSSLSQSASVPQPEKKQQKGLEESRKRQETETERQEKEQRQREQDERRKQQQDQANQAKRKQQEVEKKQQELDSMCTENIIIRLGANFSGYRPSTQWY